MADTREKKIYVVHNWFIDWACGNVLCVLPVLFFKICMQLLFVPYVVTYTDVL